LLLKLSGAKSPGIRKKFIPDPDPGNKKHRIPDPEHCVVQNKLVANFSFKQQVKPPFFSFCGNALLKR
jgi:hypothetical protein